MSEERKFQIIRWAFTFAVAVIVVVDVTAVLMAGFEGAWTVLAVTAMISLVLMIVMLTGTPARAFEFDNHYPRR